MFTMRGGGKVRYEPATTAEELSKRLTIRVTPTLARALRIRVAELDVTLQDYVAAAVEMALKIELDPRPRH